MNGLMGTPVHTDHGCYVMADGEIRVPTIRYDAIGDAFDVTVSVHPDDVAAICAAAGMAVSSLNLSEAVWRLVERSLERGAA